MASKISYPRRVAIAIDQLFNALIGGWPDESLSAHAWRWHREAKREWPRRLINLLFFFQRDHCYSAYDNECSRRHLPPEYRDV